MPTPDELATEADDHDTDQDAAADRPPEHPSKEATMPIVNPLNLPVIDEDPIHLHPIHHIDRPDDLAALTAAMQAAGWDGPPVVVHHGTGLTGVHRIHAARAAGVEVPTVQAAALFAAAGVEFDGDADLYDLEPELAALYDRLPSAVRTTYGLDA
ncbi:hypothetical protein DZF91_12535 [Actinomadura logoneensis]|uniref:Uncharacterized protein n=1 Tax=Actinomadura logoneensis TaxID=2293572 RepID=A0A372JMS2_9ACTN|nr:ParB N-terminal domain-containing protein [Actinomadura logoneensis]RFU41307.1 hypothetical protein DZF91_12535 [Actinomadura logoneensis]